MLSQFALISALLALTFGAPVDNTGKTVHIPLQKEVGKFATHNFTASSAAAKLSRRSPTDDEPLSFTGIRYYANYEIGGQSVKGLLDTGSSDTFVFNSEAGSDGYTPGQSPDYHWVNNDFDASYGSGSNQIAGSWFTDDITVGSATIKDYNLALLNQSDPNFPDNIGIIAVGPQAAETASQQYPPLYSRLKSDGFTDSQSFSLFSTDSEGSGASLLFGGVDTAKYNGPLYALPFATQEIFNNVYFSVDWQYNGVWYENGVLDSGTPFILINADIAEQIAGEYGAVFNSEQGYVANGTPDYSKPPLPITVGGVTIEVPIEYLWMESDGYYYFGVQPNISQYGGLVALNILGDPFLRSVYSFYDIDNETYYFAPIKFTSESNVVGVASSVPGSETAPDPTENHTGNGNPSF